MESNLIEKIPVHIHHFDSEQPTQLRLIKNQEIQSLEEQIKSLKKKKSKLKSEKLIQLNAQEKKYLEEISSLQKENSEKLSQENGKLDSLKKFQQDQEEKQLKELQELEGHHQNEIKIREARFSNTLNDEYRRYYALREDLDEIRLKFDNELSSILLNHEQKMKGLADFYNEKINQVQDSYTKLLDVMRKDSNEYENHINHLEEEHEMEFHQIKEKKNIELKREKEKTEEYNRLEQTQKELETNTTIDKEAIQNEVHILESSHKSLVSEVENLRNKLNKTEEQIRERDDVISRKENTIKELKAFNIHLINFHFVLNQKIATLKEERDPLDRKIKEKESSIRDMYNELLEEFSKKNSLKEKSGKLKDKNKAVEELNNHLRNQIFQNKRKMTLFQSELAQMIRTTEKDKLIQALKDLYDKQIKRAKTEEVELQASSKNSDVRETLIEASFQKSQKEILKYHMSVKERLNSIQKQNKQYQKEKTQAIFKKQHENAFLISTCNELRNEKQRLLKIISKLEDQKNTLNQLLPINTTKSGSQKITHSASVPAFSDMPSGNIGLNIGQLPDKKNPSGKLQSIVIQLDKNRDKLAQQTMEFKKLEQKVTEIMNEHKE
ncbi:hypothetical protein SteCoe_3537 [Stentor coeruleus]|uniref:Uncharacterized protein n=1 Tax=Stentor coeruleus TaxID=5963 RepID=A0A1R2CWN6_9CILI|nr:hypothetical protein SteCoe_3537 [Stentor coeruleus]